MSEANHDWGIKRNKGEYLVKKQCWQWWYQLKSIEVMGTPLLANLIVRNLNRRRSVWIQRSLERKKEGVPRHSGNWSRTCILSWKVQINIPKVSNKFLSLIVSSFSGESLFSTWYTINREDARKLFHSRVHKRTDWICPRRKGCWWSFAVAWTKRFWFFGIIGIRWIWCRLQGQEKKYWKGIRYEGSTNCNYGQVRKILWKEYRRWDFDSYGTNSFGIMQNPPFHCESRVCILYRFTCRAGSWVRIRWNIVNSHFKHPRETTAIFLMQNLCNGADSCSEFYAL